MKPAFEVADIIKHTQLYIKQHLPNSSRVLNAIAICRTATLGGHIDKCSNSLCDYVHVSYNSCRNRHCPKCQQIQKEAWLMAMQHRTLPVSYFHVVFTIPHELNSLCLKFPKLMYDTLFKVAWATLKGFAQAPQYRLKMGMTSVLHTWGQNLSLHPHIHCIVPSGGMDKNKKWKPLKGNKANGRKGFLFPIDALKRVYKAKFMAAIRKLIKLKKIPQQDTGFLNQIYQKEWVVFAKRPFAGAQQVVEYLGRYTHKIAISNHRIVDVSTTHTKFKYKDYADNGVQKLMCLENEEFIRRYSQHILPDGFTKIRHFGLHAGACTKIMDEISQQLTGKPRARFDRKNCLIKIKEKLNPNPQQCPKCNKDTLITKLIWNSGKSPPIELIRYFMTKE